MIRLVQILIMVLMLMCKSLIAQEKTIVENYKHVIISPHIEVSLVRGETPSVTVLESKVAEHKINIEGNKSK